MGVKNFKIGLDQNEKIEFIADVYKKLSKTMTMIFINERRFAQEIQSKLKSQGIEAKFLTADLELAERDQLIDEFRKEVYPVLISTNILARGIDVPQVDIVINFNIPVKQEGGRRMEPDYANFMHRVGRTGRFGTDGIAITFISKGHAHEPGFVENIAKEYSIEISELKGFSEF